MTLTISLILVAGLALLFGVFTLRSWRSERPLFKWAGTLFAGLLTVLAIIVTGSALLGLYRLYRPQAEPPPEVQVSMAPENVARGEQLAHLCSGCHSATTSLPLNGGTENELEGIATLYAPNLTPSGPLADWTDGEIVRAIREGVHRDGRALLLMPSEQYRAMSDDDVEAIVAYLRSQPPFERETPPTEVNLIGAVVVGLGVFPTSAQEPVTAPVEGPPAGDAEQVGRYLVTLAYCAACHGEDLRGGDSPFTPSGPNLAAIAATWSPEQFVTALQTGVTPSGSELDNTQMPWQMFDAAFDEEELRAIYTYLRTLPPTEQ